MKIVNQLLFLIVLFFSLKSHSQSDLNAPLTKFTLESDNSYWLNNEENRVVNLVSYFKAASNINEAHERFSMNLSIVIDRSGSMEGEKLEETKEAVNYLLKQLKPTDIVSIVTYESKVEVILPAQRVTDVQGMIKKVNKIESDGSTFLSGGMEKGYELINTVKDTLQDLKFIHRVILLSDGLANEGIIDSQALARIARTNLEEKNVSITTVGIGGDYNEKLMTDIAIAGTGNYHFVAKPGDIQEIFQTELNGVKEVVSKNTKLVITFPETVTLRQVHHYNYKLNGNQVSFDLNDVFSANEKAFLLEFLVTDGYNGDLAFSAELSYLNALNDLTMVSENKSFTIKATDSKSELAKNYLKIGSLTQIYLLSTESFQLATMAAEENNFKEAEDLLDKAMDAIAVYTSRFGKHPFLEDILANEKEYKKTLKDMQKKPSKQRNFINRGRRSYMFRTISCPAF